MGLNKCVFMGRLTKDVDYKEGDNYKLARFTIAVDRDFVKEGQQKTDFIKCTAWGGTASFVQKYFDKGSMIIVSGRLQIDEDKSDNTYKTYTSIAVENAYFGGAKKENDDTPHPAKKPVNVHVDDPEQYSIEDNPDARFRELNGEDAEEELPF